MLKYFVMIASLTVAGLAVADGDVLSEAQSLVSADRALEAYELLKPLESERAGDPDYDYIFGLSALDAGKTVEAVFALERVIDLNPEHGPAHGELARAYLALGETDDARTEFETVQAMELPEEARQTIERYMSSIDLFHDRTRTRFRPWVETGVGYDTNVNGATDFNGPVVVPIAPGIPFRLGGTENSPLWNVGGGVRFTSPLDVERGLSVFGRIAFDHRLTVDEGEFSSTFADGQLGLLLKKDKHSFNVAADGNHVTIDGSSTRNGNRESAGFSTQYQYAPNATNQFTSFAQFSIVRYPDQRVRDVNRFTGGIGWGHAFAETRFTPILFGSVFGGFEDAQDDTRGPHFGRDFWGLRGGASAQVAEKHTLSASFTYQASKYDVADPSFLVKRDDDFYDALVSYRFQYDSNWSVTPSLRYSDNRSNIVINDYDRFEVLVTIRNDF